MSDCGALIIENIRLRAKLAEAERVSEARNTAMDAVEGALEEWFGAVAREDGTFDWEESAVDGIEHLKRTVAALRAADEKRQEVINRLHEWTHVFGRKLCPGNYQDTFGEGIRAAKKQVVDLLAVRVMPTEGGQDE